MTDDLAELGAVVHGISGAITDDQHRSSLRAALARVDPRLTPKDVLSDPDPTNLERLVDEVAVNETFFLRHPEELSGIDWLNRAAVAEAGGRALRVWSVGCSTGEEAYSLALLAAEALGEDRPSIDVLGTDLSAAPIELARRGLYGARSMRLVGRERRERWFVADGERQRAGAELRGLVRFARHNLIHDPCPPAGEAPFDLVVCRNVLIYFDWPTVTRVRAALQDALAPAGELLLGTVDRLGSTPRDAVAPAAAERRPPSGRAESRWAADAAQAALAAGVSALRCGDARAAVTALRRALYLEPRQPVAALQLARAHEALADVGAARRTYERTLHIVEDDPQSLELWGDEQIAPGDVAAVCRARLAVL